MDKKKDDKKQDNKSSKELVKFNSTFEGASFDTIFEMDEKEKNKQISYQQKKGGKKLQLVSKINDLDMRLMKAQNRFNLSLTDPTIDSVDILIEMKCHREERKIASDLHNQLFPDSVIPSLM